jgi:hypothetical protein
LPDFASSSDDASANPASPSATRRNLSPGGTKANRPSGPVFTIGTLLLRPKPPMLSETKPSRVAIATSAPAAGRPSGSRTTPEIASDRSRAKSIDCLPSSDRIDRESTGRYPTAYTRTK